LRRFPARTRAQPEKSPRFRGVLAVGLSRIRTGDGGFGASKAQQPTFFSVGKLGGSDSLQIRLGVLRVRILLAPPPSLPTQRLFGKSARRPGKSRDSAGFWARGFAHPNRRLRVPSPKEAAARVFLCCQVGRFGFALDSPHRRPGSVEQYCEFESYSLRHPVCCCRDFAPASRNSPRNSRDSAGFWPSSPGVSEPETAGSGPRSGRSPCFSLLPSWAVRFRSRFASAKAGLGSRVLKFRIRLSPPEEDNAPDAGSIPAASTISQQIHVLLSCGNRTSAP